MVRYSVEEAVHHLFLVDRIAQAIIGKFELRYRKEADICCEALNGNANPVSELRAQVRLVRENAKSENSAA